MGFGWVRGSLSWNYFLLEFEFLLPLGSCYIKWIPLLFPEETSFPVFFIISRLQISVVLKMMGVSGPVG